MAVYLVLMMESQLISSSELPQDATRNLNKLNKVVRAEKATGNHRGSGVPLEANTTLSKGQLHDLEYSVKGLVACVVIWGP